jgi:hypothetical protein
VVKWSMVGENSFMAEPLQPCREHGKNGRRRF